MENIKGQNIIAGIFANPNKKRALEAVSAAKSILDRVGVRWADCGKPDTIYEGGTVDAVSYTHLAYHKIAYRWVWASGIVAAYIPAWNRQDNGASRYCKEV